MANQVRIITDSVSDLPPALAQRLGITVLPIYLLIGNESYRDDGLLDRAAFYERLWQTPRLFGTASPPPSEFQAVYEQLAAAGASDIVGLFIASSLSSVASNAQLAGQQVRGARVHVLETGQVTMGLGWMAVAAAEAAAQGASVSEITALIQKMRPRTTVTGVLRSLDYVHRGGRVGWARAKMGDLLQIKPLIAIHDSEVSLLGRVRTHHRALQALADWLHQRCPLERAAVLHSGVEPELQTRFRAIVQECLPAGEVPIVAVSPAFGVHVGPGAIGVAVVTA